MAMKAQSLLPKRTQREPDVRPSARKRGYDARWDAFAKSFLRKHPLCVDCSREGRDEPATQVDHIVPLREAPKRKFDPTNLQGLCRPHHTIKTRAGR
jgi:5-methylcytosine-specific restriction protein A